MPKFAVAAGHELTVEAASAVLADGGTAVDAVVAAAAMAMVAEPVLAGLLGGGFLMVREANGKAHLLDFFVQTPRRSTPEHELDFTAIDAQFGTATQEFHIGAGTIATPGVGPGLAEAHQRFGAMAMAELMGPACQAARQGVVVTPYQAQLSQIVEAILTATPGAMAHWLEDAALPTAGAMARNPALADVLEVYGHEGPRFVSEGEVAQALLALTAEGGHLTATDLRRYTPRWRTPLSTSRHGARISLNPFPALGGALVAFGLQVCPRAPGPADMARTLQATHAARIASGTDLDPSSGVPRLLAPDLVTSIQQQLSNRQQSTRGTTHISVIDRMGMSAALTLSNGEGCGHMLPGTGIMPNNMLGEADLLPSGMHSWTPDQRLSSMMCPLIVDWPDGSFAVMGSGGSNRIRSALMQILVGLIDHDLSPHEAVAAARIHVDAGAEPGAPDAVDFEDLGNEAFRDALLSEWPEARAWPERSMFFGGAHVALSDPRGNLRAVGDLRRSGASRVE